ncbi:MAG: hypothetical protein U5K81_07655 [Trueperaceae bacterium]|nr:hypothetical protein [Trueperaceae bacterium]
MRVLAIADTVSPFVYTPSFPHNLPPFDLVVSAGDMPGYVLEFVATKLTVQPLYVMGNHANGYLRDPQDRLVRPGGCIDVHRRVTMHHGLLVAGFEGSARYKPGPHQFSDAEFSRMVAGMTPRFAWNRFARGRALDLLLTHAPPKGPHEGTDRPHRGIGAFNRLHRWWRPRVHVHGHVHLSGANAPREYVTDEGVRVINAFGFAVFEL